MKALNQATETTAMSDLSSYPAAQALTTVQGYRMLTNGWDGPDSRAPHPEHLTLATLLFKNWPADLPVPSAMISADGTVGMYWPSLEHLYLDAEYDEQGLMSVFARRRHDGHEHFQERLSPQDGLATVLHIVRHGI